MAEEKKPEEKKEEKKEEKPKAEDKLVTTKHSVKFKGRELKYTVTAGTMVLKEETGDREKEAEGEKPKAQVFFIAYSKDGVKDPAKRPLTFSFNGGPGSSSVWLHLGVLGPRPVVLTDEGERPPPPLKLTDTEYSLLDETDLVFIDTVSGQDIPENIPDQNPDDFASVAIHGNPFIGKDNDGIFHGWLIVNGTLQISGGMRLEGLVYTVNDFVYNGTGNGRIKGLVVSQNIRDATASSISDVQTDSTTTGNSRVIFDCEATKSRDWVPEGFLLQAGTYRELEGDSL